MKTIKLILSGITLSLCMLVPGIAEASGKKKVERELFPKSDVTFNFNDSEEKAITPNDFNYSNIGDKEIFNFDCPSGDLQKNVEPKLFTEINKEDTNKIFKRSDELKKQKQNLHPILLFLVIEKQKLLKDNKALLESNNTMKLNLNNTIKTFCGHHISNEREKTEEEKQNIRKKITDNNKTITDNIQRILENRTKYRNGYIQYQSTLKKIYKNNLELENMSNSLVNEAFERMHQGSSQNLNVKSNAKHSSLNKLKSNKSSKEERLEIERFKIVVKKERRKLKKYEENKRKLKKKKTYRKLHYSERFQMSPSSKVSPEKWQTITSGKEVEETNWKPFGGFQYE